MRLFSGFLSIALSLATAAPRLAAYGVDAGTGAEVFRKNVAEPFGITGREVRWQRVRGLPNPETSDAEAIARARDELRALRARGAKSAVMLRFGVTSWANGVRKGAGQRMPLDLRDAFERGRAYAAAYGDLVDAWEIDNEPDISFVEENPETFTAYFKAIGLGLKAADRRQTADGRRQRADGSGRTAEGGAAKQRGEGAASPLFGLPPSGSTPPSAVSPPPSESEPPSAVRPPSSGSETQASGPRFVSAAAQGAPASGTLPLRSRASVIDAGHLRALALRQPSANARRWPVKPFFGGASLPSDSTQVSGVVSAAAQGAPASATLRSASGPASSTQAISALSRSVRFHPSASAPLVLMAPLALPPGPYLERSLRNDLLSYTDGFNYHYYGYTEDFSGVYRQFEDALASPSSDVRHLTSGFRQLPVFLTEYGYGLLSGEAAGTVEGRVRQWQWFADVLPQVRALRIEGPMAFVAMPYLEQGHNEFGLFMKAQGEEQTAEGGGPTTEGRRQTAEIGDRRSGGGRGKAAARGAVNQRGGGAASPFSGLAPNFSRPQPSAVRHPSSALGSPRAISGLPRSVKSHPSSFAHGEGSIVLYNFSGEAVSGRLELPEGFTLVDPSETEAHGAATPSSRASAKEPAKASPPGATAPSPRKPEQNAAQSRSSGPRPLEQAGFEAGGLAFAPADFGAKRAEPWMKRIGGGAYQKADDSDSAAARWEASPAAAYLWDYAARHPYRPRQWNVQVAPAAAVVIDFVAGDGLTQYKAAGGYVVGQGKARSAGKAEGGTEASGRQSDNLKPEFPNQGSDGGRQKADDRRRPVDGGAANQGGEGAASPLFGPPPSGSTVPSGSTPPSAVSRQPSDSAPPSAISRLPSDSAPSGSDTQVSGLRSQVSVVRIPPGERLVVPVRIRVQAERFEPEAVEVRFIPEEGSQPIARWSTQLVPAATGMTTETVARFDHPAESAAEARALLLARPLAREEPRLEPQGRWLVSRGVTVVADSLPVLVRNPSSGSAPPSAIGRLASGSTLPSAVSRLPSGSTPSSGSTPPSGTWRFRVEAFPEEPLHAARVELPLPVGFRFEPGTVLSLQHRIEAAASENPQRPHMLDVQVRTANGNLYVVWPRQVPRAEWRTYWLHVDNFTMGFFGRASLPWRFQDNEPVSLVLFLRPGSLPATFEFKPAELVRWKR